MIKYDGVFWKVYKKNKIEVGLINKKKETLIITRQEYEDLK